MASEVQCARSVSSPSPHPKLWPDILKFNILILEFPTLVTIAKKYSKTKVIDLFMYIGNIGLNIGNIWIQNNNTI
jgi:hypothetical protein